MLLLFELYCNHGTIGVDGTSKGFPIICIIKMSTLPALLNVMLLLFQLYCNHGTIGVDGTSKGFPIICIIKIIYITCFAECHVACA